MSSFKKLLGKSIKLYLKQGGAFNFKVTGWGESFLVGYDDECMELLVSFVDIEYVTYNRR